MLDNEYRPGVGLMILNADNQVFVGERVGKTGGFQMPQGGIDDGEELEQTVYRELTEETGMTPDNTSIISFIDEWIYHDFPLNLRKRIFNGCYKGQRQKWFLLNFKGSNDDIDLQAHEIQEFCSYKWVSPIQLEDIATPFKKKVYSQVVNTFSSYF